MIVAELQTTSNASDAMLAEQSTIVSQVESKIDSTTSRQVLLSCMIGNALEWYDFVIYGYFAVILGKLFFPEANHVTQLLASWGVFWSGFLARPLGSIFFGHIGDKKGRKSALTLSIYVMAIPTMLIGCLPTFEQAGVIATVGLVVLRALQGFAIGGEFTGSMVFLVEHSPSKTRGFWGSWASFSAVIGVIMGSTLIAYLNNSISTDEMQVWGWRIPFLLSILGSFVGGYMRRRLNDPGVYLDMKARGNHGGSVPLKSLIVSHKSKIALIIFLDFLTAVGFFIVAIFLATYFRTHLKYPANIALSINTFNMCVFAAAILLGGWLSDHFGRKQTLAYPCIGFILFSYPLFLWMQQGDYWILLAAQAILCFMMGIFFGTIPTALSEIMPTNIRYSGLSISHNISMAIFGGGTPILATHLIQYTHNLASPAYLLIVASSLSLLSLIFFKDRYRLPLDH